MAEVNINIPTRLGISSNKIRLEAMNIKAEGAPDYIRLIIPFEIEMNPIRDKNEIIETLTIFSISVNLFIQGSDKKFADALPLTKSHRIIGTYNRTIYPEFPLDNCRINKIEEIRKGGDLAITVNICFVVGIFAPLQVQIENKPETKYFLNEINDYDTTIQAIKIHNHTG